MFNVGDKVVCIVKMVLGPNIIDADLPVLNNIYTVSKTDRGLSKISLKVINCIHLAELNSGWSISSNLPGSGYPSEGFRKVVKDTTEKCEEEFITLLKNMKVKKKGKSNV